MEKLNKREADVLNSILCYLDPHYDELFKIPNLYKYSNKSEPTIYRHFQKLLAKGYVQSIVESDCYTLTFIKR